MAHLRKRYIRPAIEKLMAFSPIVGLFGHRQVGKSTLIAEYSSEYITLDLLQSRTRLDADPFGFLNGLNAFPVGIDEAQLSPELFPALKEWVRLHRKPRQFLLSGSVRFTSRRAIRESLTGRIVHLDLLPMAQAELDERPLNRFVIQAFSEDASQLVKRISRVSPVKSGVMERYLKTGGLPGICFIRSDALRVQRLESQLETILDRDLRLVIDSRLPLSTLRNVLVNLSILQGLPVELSDLSRKTRVSVPTLRNLLVAFESIFLIRKLPAAGTEKHPVYFFEDQGEATHLTGHTLDPLSDITRFLFAQIRIPLQLELDKRTEFFQYRTRSGAFLPLCVKLGPRVLGLLPILEENPNRQAIGSATSFLRRFQGARVLFVHPQAEGKSLAENMISVPIDAFV